MRKNFNKKLSFTLFFFLLVSVLLSGYTFSQINKTLAFSGIVLNESDNPISNLKITVVDSNIEAITNSNGEFTLSDLSNGKTLFALIGNEGTGQVYIDVKKDMPSITLHYPVITEIAILHVNDTHGEINNFPKLTWYLNQYREDYTNLLLLSAGDMFSGNPVVDQYDPKGKPMIDLMNAVGFDAMCIGNHDFDYGQEILKDRIADADFPLICANLNVTTGILPQPKPYITFKTDNDLNIAILGLLHISSSGIPNTHPDKIQGIEFTEELEAATDYVDLATENNLVIGLTHLGIDKDQALAEQMSELDLIIGGHSHSEINTPTEVNGVTIAQAGDDLNYLGKVIVTLENGEVKSVTGELIDLQIEDGDTEINENIQAMVNAFYNNESLTRVIGSALNPIDGKEELGSLITDSITEVHNLDIAFQNNGGIRISSLENDITVSDVYELLPFGNEIIKYNMTTTEIRSLITYGCRYDSIDLRVSGINYAVTVTDGEMEIALTNYSGNPIDESQTYTVGVNSFIASGYEFDCADSGISLYVTDAETLVQYIENGASLDYAGIERTSIKIITTSGNELATTEVAITAGDSQYDGSNTAGNLMTDAIRDFTGADFATFPSNSINTGVSIEPGSVYEEALEELYKYVTNNVVVAEIKGNDLKDFVQARSDRYDNADIQVSGMEYTITVDSTNDTVIVECFEENGTPIDDNTTYVVAFDSYNYGKYYGLSDKVLSEKETTETQWDILVDYLTNLTDPIPASLADSRITIQ
ncbi:MAG: 5'-nucleotidase C-terminal domain-containing protein [Halanaerobiales bacterium]|nr:5'-nucleotidase C-terminal domain-containing protein [Halanaerobiales bacterium]